MSIQINVAKVDICLSFNFWGIIKQLFVLGNTYNFKFILHNYKIVWKLNSYNWYMFVIWYNPQHSSISSSTFGCNNVKMLFLLNIDVQL